jgi:hypothetical protein
MVSKGAFALSFDRLNFILHRVFFRSRNKGNQARYCGAVIAGYSGKVIEVIPKHIWGSRNDDK